MNPRTLASFERMMEHLERRQRRSGRHLSAATLALVAGLFLGYALLAILIPQAWPALLPGAPGEMLQGWPRLVWGLSEACVQHGRTALAALTVASVIIVVLSFRYRFVRVLVWILALVVICTDAGILATTLLACLQAAGGGF